MEKQPRVDYTGNDFVGFQDNAAVRWLSRTLAWQRAKLR
jgi:hypothetical protein